MTKRLDAEKILATLAELRRSMPRPTRPYKKKETSSRFDARTAEEFDMIAIADAVEGLADELHAALEEKQEALYEQALDVYYAAEELARDPANADIAVHAENMRKAYEKSYGRPIPTKEETVKRREAKKSEPS